MLLALIGIPVFGIVLGPLAYLLAGAARRRLAPGRQRVLASTGRVLSILVTVGWLVVVVGYGTALWQLSRAG